MGQNTYSRVGVTVTLEFTLANLPLICTLMRDASFSTFTDVIHERCCADEVCWVVPKWEDDDAVLEDELALCQTEEDVAATAKRVGFTRFKFIYMCCETYARNISCRYEPNVFHNMPSTPEDMAQQFLKGKQLFLDAGVPEDAVAVGYVFTGPVLCAL